MPKYPLIPVCDGIFFLPEWDKAIPMPCTSAEYGWGGGVLWEVGDGVVWVGVRVGYVWSGWMMGVIYLVVGFSSLSGYVEQNCYISR